MPLYLTIENEASLPDGGPLSITVTSKRGIDIGRDQYLDWVLPDPTRFISGKHCEIRYSDGQYWLRDVSTNGTFVNRNEFRIDGAHALKDGDRLEIGRYIIGVRVEPDAADGYGQDPGPGGGALWDIGGEAAPPINPNELRARPTAAERPDFLDWAADFGSPPPPLTPQAMPPSAPP
ncbi:MAG: type VI secretion system-associated FHA domain protein, partial [Beijerinckiaceae bacterium]